jgi:hypothetical protein
MASLRRNKTLSPDGQTARFLYTIIKQLDLKSIDWNLVAGSLDITNGHAARMRYSRFKQHMEGGVTQGRAPKAGGKKEKEGKEGKETLIAKGSGKKRGFEEDAEEEKKTMVRDEGGREGLRPATKVKTEDEKLIKEENAAVASTLSKALIKIEPRHPPTEVPGTAYPAPAPAPKTEPDLNHEENHTSSSLTLWQVPLHRTAGSQSPVSPPPPASVPGPFRAAYTPTYQTISPADLHRRSPDSPSPAFSAPTTAAAVPRHIPGMTGTFAPAMMAAAAAGGHIKLESGMSEPASMFETGAGGMVKSEPLET